MRPPIQTSTWYHHQMSPEDSKREATGTDPAHKARLGKGERSPSARTAPSFTKPLTLWIKPWPRSSRARILSSSLLLTRRRLAETFQFHTGSSTRLTCQDRSLTTVLATSTWCTLLWNHHTWLSHKGITLLTHTWSMKSWPLTPLLYSVMTL